MPYERSLGEILSAHGETLKDEIKKAIPATVVAVHPERQTVDVQIAIKNPLHDEYGEVTFEDAQAIADVPVGFFRGGGFFVYVPVLPGDSVLLIFSDLSTDTWRASGGGPALEPAWVGKHTLDSAFAIPCIAPDGGALTEPVTAAGKVVIGKAGGASQIRIGAADIELGANAIDFVAMASKVMAELTKIKATLLTGTTSAGPVTFGSPYEPGDVASTLVKAL